MAGEDFILKFQERAESIHDKTERSKKYRAGVATLAQKGVASNDMDFLEAAIRFTDHIIDEHDRSKAYVDIVRSTSRVARNTKRADLVQRGLELSAHTGEGQDRSHALEGIVSAMAEVGIKKNDPGAIEIAKELAGTITYDTYRSSSWRSIARILLSADDHLAAKAAATRALDIIDSSDSIRPILRASAYIDLSRLFLDLGQIDTARTCIENAESSAHTLDNQFDRSSIYQSIAETYLTMGVRTRDRMYFERAVTSLDQITREYYRTSTRNKIRNIVKNSHDDTLVP